MTQAIGEIIQVIGPVVDVSFEKESGELPHIFDALEIKRSDGQSVILEVQQDIGENTLRTPISLDITLNFTFLPRSSVTANLLTFSFFGNTNLALTKPEISDSVVFAVSMI